MTANYRSLIDPVAARNAEQNIVNEKLNSIYSLQDRELKRLRAYSESLLREQKRIDERLSRLENVGREE